MRNPIANECGAYSTEWQEHFIRFIHDYEKGKVNQHPVGMTFSYSRDPSSAVPTQISSTARPTGFRRIPTRANSTIGPIRLSFREPKRLAVRSCLR